MHAQRAVVSVSAIRPWSDIVAMMRVGAGVAAIACAASVVLLLATAISNYLRVVGFAAPDWSALLSPFAVPMGLLVLALLLLVARQRAASMTVATGGTIVSLLWWMTLTL